jgi:hypothetical protein
MEWHAPLLPTRSRLCAFRYTVRACYTSWVQTIPYISRCGASSATPRREIACTGRLLAAEHSSGALPAFRHSLGSHCPRCVSRTSVPVTHKTEARVYFAAGGCDGASGRSLTIAPCRLRTSSVEQPPLAPNRHVPCPTQRTHAVGLWWRDGAHSQRKIRSKSWEKVTSPMKL